ncbi:tyrosine-type recombinase/integrase [Belliella sp. DSM 111904]|uniref:Tyrosine-type recombinase/integrase n=1 Tax=Belliella filtrata TaxID=2923435 RepID=A0ABS9V5P2_9BACT|nr:tyrosine-type recombinase/integrase [Belliella filtrata]MCH7411746.1 tyrosine-type recombinase/integrase [Belliella filtrata]
MLNDSELKAYLLEKHTPETAKIYLRDIRIYLDYMTEERAEKATYQDILQYVDYLRKKHKNPRTVNRMLYGAKSWHNWLLHTGKREDHPCRFLRLRDAKGQDIQLQDLFSSTELEQLMERKERYESVRVRNQVVVSLLIYQGLRLKETEQVSLQDVDLEAGTVYSRGMAKTLPRTLKMKPKQIMLFYRYIHEIRPKTISEYTDQLILNIRGKAIKADDINYLVETFRDLFPERKLNAQTIRQSVIANLLKEGKDLRVVQVFAGHKNPSSTERYRQTGLEELKAAVQKHHPLG